MDDLSAEQFLENVKNWKPDGDFRKRVEARLRSGKIPAEMAGDLGGALEGCSGSTYDYLQYINRLATVEQIDRKNFLSEVAHLVGLVEAVQEKGRRFLEAFKRYDAVSRPELTRDRFDTVYFDAIQGVDIRGLLKPVFDEVEVILQSFSLVTQDLSGVPCADLYEGCVRFQLFLQYLLTKEDFPKEELWSLLFDINSQVSEMQEVRVEPTEEELKSLQERIQKYKTN